MLNTVWAGDATLLALKDDWQDDQRLMLTARHVPADKVEAVLDGVAALMRSWADPEAVPHIPSAFDVVQDALWQFQDCCGHGPGTREAEAVMERLTERGFTFSHPAIVEDDATDKPWFVMTPYGWHEAIEKVLVDQGLTEAGDQMPTQFTKNFLHFVRQFAIYGGYMKPAKKSRKKAAAS